VLFQTKARIVILSGQELGPTQASLRSQTAIMITSSDSPRMGSGMPNQYLDVFCTSSRFPGSPACEPNLT